MSSMLCLLLGSLVVTIGSEHAPSARVEMIGAGAGAAAAELLGDQADLAAMRSSTMVLLNEEGGHGTAEGGHGTDESGHGTHEGGHETNKTGEGGHDSPAHPSGAHHGPHPHEALLFFFTALALGALSMHLLSRFMPSLPYTVVLLSEGFFIGWLDHWSEGGLGTFSRSLNMWVHIDPHLLLFAFLPPLIFGDSMSLNWHMWIKCFGQCLLLAGPGVLIGTGLTAMVGKWIFPYGWTWYEAGMFGSILAATDPVAVVSILQELGVPEKLTMCVSGESLLNDGTAIVLFNLFKALALNTPESMEDVGGTYDPVTGGSVSAWDVTVYFCWMSFGGVALGAFFGFVAVVWISHAKRKTGHEDCIIQISVTIAVAYAVFFIGEFFFKVSGVLATVACALCVASSGWPHFVSRENMASIWHVIEHIGNTLIFIVAGAIIGADFGDRTFAKVMPDCGWLLVLYVCSMVIRFAMVFLFLPGLKCMGSFTVADAVVLSWGGLRGAVGLALALDVDIAFKDRRPGSEHDKSMGRQMLFHVGGMAVLTLVVNGITSSAVVGWLGLAGSDKYHTKLLHDVEHRVTEKVKKVYDEEVKHFGEHLNEKQLEFVRRRVRALNDDTNYVSSHVHANRAKTGAGEREFAHSVRELFLTMLRSKYLDLVDRGVLSTHGQATMILSTSVDMAMDDTHHALSDWKSVEKACRWKTNCSSLVDSCVKYIPARGKAEEFMTGANVVMREMTACLILLSFVEGHKRTQKGVKKLFGNSEEEDEKAGLKDVIDESSAEIEAAQGMLGLIEPTVLQMAECDQLINVLLESERRFIMKLVEEGALQEKEGHHLLEVVSSDMGAKHTFDPQDMDASRRRSHRTPNDAIETELQAQMSNRPSHWSQASP